MEFRRRNPPPPLAGLIEALWYWDGPARSHDFERLLPDGSMELIINLYEDEVRVYDRRDRSRFERLLAADTLGERFDILGSALLARIARPLEHHRAVSHALVEFGAGHRTIAD